MPLIDTEEPAVRLAKALVADLTLYNGAAIAAEEDLSALVEEGRVLFRGRTSAPLWGVYEKALAGSAFAACSLDGVALIARAKRDLETPPAPPPERSSPLLIVLCFVLAAMGLAVALLLR